ncbi:cytochrome c oxidase subunit I [Alteromonas sp. ASW11-19]|uniref:cytochrome-c oxidase n=1 Tax=Alteromonas salexigens TaxID=2982530 RepID=A0ABT2VUC7_9ALTE|nr:cytochrome c oxidase subunit I [Alteromonas salexigens]MCU7556033.1 cytochrome c oxidase subunit I [Alteromonas salexigens]
MSNQQLHHRMAKVWDNLPGWGNLAAVNHTSISKRFMLTGIAFFFVGITLAMLIRTQLAKPGQSLLDADVYAQVFTMHGTIMMFLFAIPVLEGAAMYLVPKMIGTRDLVFPRLSAFGYYCYLFGGLIVLSSLVLGIAPSSGWFMYTPLSGAEYSPGPGSDFWLLGITFVEISAVSAGIELTVSILRTRAPGMSLAKMPIFCWYILAMALMIVFGFPPLILASILLELERAAQMPFFDPAAGGDPLLWQHLFWLFGHPEVYIIFLPAAGIVSTILPVFAGRPLAGYRWLVLSVITTGFISFGLWVHHMFTVGIPQLAQAFFSVASMLVAVPTAIQVFVWMATLWTGRVRFELPMLWICGFLFIFVCGGLTGVMLALVPFDWQVHDTHFVIAHFHYVLIGGMLFPLIGALYYWLPLLSGRKPSMQLGKWAFALVFIGFNGTFLLMHLTGLLGMPRRVFTYQSEQGWDWLNLSSSVGGFVLATGLVMVALDVILHFKFGPKAKPNPWRADTLEWAAGMPPLSYNFASIPTIKTRHPLWDSPGLIQSIPAGAHGLARIEHGRRELYGTEAISGKLKTVFHIPTHSWWPLICAAVLAGLCISLLTRQYLLAVGVTATAAALLFRWSWENGTHKTMAPLTDNESDSDEPPLHSRTADGPGLWGIMVMLMADGALYLSLVFGWLYLWTVSPNGELPDTSSVSRPLMLTSGIFLTLGTLLYRNIEQKLRGGGDSGFSKKLYTVCALTVCHLGLLIWAMVASDLKLTSRAADAVMLVMFAFLIFHSGMSVVASLLQTWRIKQGHISQTLFYEVSVLYPLWLYTLGIFWVSVCSFVLLPAWWEAA